jgi:hypothetical protein
MADKRPMFAPVSPDQMDRTPDEQEQVRSQQTVSADDDIKPQREAYKYRQRTGLKSVPRDENDRARQTEAHLDDINTHWEAYKALQRQSSQK